MSETAESDAGTDGDAIDDDEPTLARVRDLLAPGVAGRFVTHEAYLGAISTALDAFLLAAAAPRSGLARAAPPSLATARQQLLALLDRIRQPPRHLLEFHLDAIQQALDAYLQARRLEGNGG